MGDTNSSHDRHPYINTTIIDQSLVTDFTPQLLSKYKRSLSIDNEPPAKKFKVDEPRHQIAIIVPIMASRFQQIISTYTHWRRNGFDIVLVFNKDEQEAITTILQQHAPDMMTTFKLRSYITKFPPNAGIAKSAAYYILQKYLNLPQFSFALLLDDTVNDIIDTHTGKSIMTNPTEFHGAVITFAEESPIFGGTVAYKRHLEECSKHRGTATVIGGFLQQALIFSCRGTPTLTKHFGDLDEYIMKMKKLSYKRVPFGEDVAFQIALYEQEILSKRKSPQFWGLGVSRIKHKSATKRPFDQLDDEAKEALKSMLIYLQEQHALTISHDTNELSGVKVIPGGRIRIVIRGRKGERPWREAYNYTFPCSQENDQDLINK